MKLWMPEQEGGDDEYSVLLGNWEEFLSRFQWTHFICLTLDGEASAAAMERKALNFIRALRAARRPGGGARSCRDWAHPLPRAVREAFWWFWVVERGMQGEAKPHIHVLLGGLEAGHSAAVLERWSCGRATVDVYEKERRGVRYTLKEVALPDGREWMIDPHIEQKVQRWIRRRRREGSERARLARAGEGG